MPIRHLLIPWRIWEHANADILETFLEAQVEHTHDEKKSVWACVSLVFSMMEVFFLLSGDICDF